MKKISYLYIIIAAILWGGIGIFFKLLYDIGFSQIQIVAIRVFSAAAVLSAYIFFKNKNLFKIKIKDCWCFIGTGIISLVFFNWCYFTAIGYTSLAVAAVLLYTSPIFVMLLSALLFKEKINLQKIIALILTFAGCIFVSGFFETGDTHFSLIGFLIGIGAGIGYALYSIFSRFALEKGYNSITISIYTFLFASLGSLPISRFDQAAGLILKPETLVGAFGIGVVCCIFPFILYTKGLSGVETGKAAIMATIEPVVATLFSIFLFNEKITQGKLIGILLIFSSVIILNLQFQKKKQEQGIVTK